MILENNKTYYSKKGINSLNSSIIRLEGIKKSSTRLKEEDRTSFDNLSENSGFLEKNRVGMMLESDLRNLRKILLTVDTLEPHNNPENIDIEDFIEISLSFNGNDEIFTAQLSGDYYPEMPDIEGIITINSPLGRAIYNKEAGYSSEYKVNDSIIKFRIVGFGKSMEGLGESEMRFEKK